MFNLIPWKRKEETNLSKYRKDFDNLADRFFKTGFSPLTEDFFEKSWYPTLDVSEGKKDIVVKAEIPGVEAKDIDVSLNGRILTIKGEKKQEKEEKNKNYQRVERFYGHFSRAVELPAEVDEAKVEASYKKGILKVTLKKSKESEFKKIEIKQG